MNANELADRLDKYASFNSAPLLFTKSAAMLRQQEAELTEAGGMIGVLKEYISDLENGLDSSIKLNKAQAGRQVKETLDTRSYLMGRYDTSPVKELTDEEILEQVVFCFGNQSEDFDDSYWVNFARAILRKAQEK